MTEPAEPTDFLYLATVGHKSGRPHLIEIWYVEREGRYYVVSERREKSHWVQNVRQQPEVAFMVNRRLRRARGRALDPAAEPELHAAVRALMDQRYDWSDGLIVEIAPV
ncbi:MAG TPA: nitroreductase/quinone reductase family protein [Myxococcota bacterium]|nr:nitroreductase/quinone reductase family protein [Myxococcota bacterium]